MNDMIASRHMYWRLYHTSGEGKERYVEEKRHLLQMQILLYQQNMKINFLCSISSFEECYFKMLQSNRKFRRFQSKTRREKSREIFFWFLHHIIIYERVRENSIFLYYIFLEFIVYSKDFNLFWVSEKIFL